MGGYNRYLVNYTDLLRSVLSTWGRGEVILLDNVKPISESAITTTQERDLTVTVSETPLERSLLASSFTSEVNAHVASAYTIWFPKASRRKLCGFIRQVPTRKFSHLNLSLSKARSDSFGRHKLLPVADVYIFSPGRY